MQDFLERDVSPEERVFSALATAEDRVSRLDERISASGFKEGWRTRADVRAVTGALSAAGVLVHPEDLLLHDLGAEARIPDGGVLMARGLLQARRKAFNGGPELLSWRGISWLAGLVKHAPPPGPRPTAEVGRAFSQADSLYVSLAAFFKGLERGETDSARGGVEDCLAVLDLRGAPPLLQAAAFLDAWRVVDPLPSQKWVGALVAGVTLRVSKRFSGGLFPIEVAQRRRPIPPRLAWRPLAERLAFWLELMTSAAELELEELTRLGHQKRLIERKAAGTRRNSHASDLARLAVETPVLTTESISRALEITPQASLQLVRRFDGVLVEITGRSRFRVWRL